MDYTDDGTSDTFVLHISRDPAEKKSAADAEDEEASDITAYARVGDSKIIYQISGSSYRSLMAAGYNDLRHQEIFSGDFDDVTGIDITLYRCDGSKCLAVVDGKSVAYVPRGEMVTLAEAVRVIALN